VSKAFAMSSLSSNFGIFFFLMTIKHCEVYSPPFQSLESLSAYILSATIFFLIFPLREIRAVQAVAFHRLMRVQTFC
jgi:hypothetical protein